MRTIRLSAHLGVLACLGLGACSSEAPDQEPEYEYQDMVEPSAALATPRYDHTATLLEDGQVLVVGGTIDTSISGFVYADTAELYDPEADTHQSIPMLAARTAHGAVRLANGDVLVVGGVSSTGAATQSLLTTEIFRAEQGDFVEGPPLVSDKYDPLTMLRSDGSVLVAPRDGTVELLAPNATSFVALDGTPTYRYETFGAFRIDDDRVLYLGGFFISMGDDSGAATVGEVYDVQAQSFRETGPLAQSNNGMPRAVPLEDGTLAVFNSYIQIFDPETETFRLSEIEDPPFLPFDSAIARLQDGRVIAAGGKAPSAPTAEVYVFDFVAGTVEVFDGLSKPRWELTATMLLDGRVYLAGGSDQAGNGPYSLADVDLFY